MLRDIKTIEELSAALGLGPERLATFKFGTYHYRSIPILHKGKCRKLSAPQPELLGIQRALAKLLSTEYIAPPAVHGYVPGRSAITNARRHLRQRHVFNIDLANFFPSILRSDLIRVISAPRYGTRPAIAEMIANIACMEGHLPIGSPCSPIISNILLQDFDDELTMLCIAMGCRYTRFSDDMTISTWQELFPAAFAKCDGEFVEVGFWLSRLLLKTGLRINVAKTRIAGPSQRKMVTGLVVNERLNLGGLYLVKLKRQLYEWRSRGLKNATARFNEHRRSQSDYREVLFGRIQYVGAVRGSHDAQYRRLRREFNLLNQREIRLSR